MLAGYDVKGDHRIYAMNPHRHHLPTKVRVLIIYLIVALDKDG